MIPFIRNKTIAYIAKRTTIPSIIAVMEMDIANKNANIVQINAMKSRHVCPIWMMNGLPSKLVTCCLRNSGSKYLIRMVIANNTKIASTNLLAIVKFLFFILSNFCLFLFYYLRFFSITKSMNIAISQYNSLLLRNNIYI